MAVISDRFFKQLAEATSTDFAQSVSDIMTKSSSLVAKLQDFQSAPITLSVSANPNSPFLLVKFLQIRRYLLARLSL